MTVTLSEPGLNIAEPGYHPIRDAFGTAWRNFTAFIASIIASLGWVLPLGAIVLVGWKLARRAWRRRVEQ
jgi:hypothetical protein